MKTFFSTLLVLFLIISCTSQKNHIRFSQVDNDNGNDSIEYELIIFEPTFEIWYSMQNNPSTYHSQSYYESWNRQYVLAWNQHSMHSRSNNFFETIVGYEYGVDYGFELNHKLFQTISLYKTTVILL